MDSKLKYYHLQIDGKIIMSYRTKVETELRTLMVDKDIGGHGMEHFLAVANHAVAALEYENLDDKIKLQIELAALLHDADETKIFPNNHHNENARDILLRVLDMDDKDIWIENIIFMINLVSCSKNGDDEVPHPWLSIPRDCDRLEAIGEIGIQRCKEYTDHIKAPYHTKDTPRAYSRKEVWRHASYERFSQYKNGRKSASMIDHYYDKLLHIGHPSCLKSQNKYILTEAATRNDILVDFVLNYWRQH